MFPLNPYPGRAGREIDLRKELNDTLMGGNMEIPKGQLVILRVMRKSAASPAVPTDSQLHLIPCDCVDAVTREPDKTYPCNICDGEGYLFDEFFAPAYKEERYEYVDVEEYKQYAKATIAMSFFYIEFYQELSRFDKIIEPQVDIDGNVVSPVTVYRHHSIHMAQKMRADEGRTEFWRCSTYTE